jgi:hypothetical protein
MYRHRPNYPHRLLQRNRGPWAKRRASSISIGAAHTAARFLGTMTRSGRFDPRKRLARDTTLDLAIVRLSIAMWMGMESLDNRREADDSYRALSRR